MIGSLLMPRTNFSDWLTKARQGKGWSMRRLEDESGISQAYISKIENGTIPSRKIIKTLAEKLEANEKEGLLAAGFTTEDPKAEDNKIPDLILEPIFDELNYAASSNELTEEGAADIAEYIRFKREQERKRRGL